MIRIIKLHLGLIKYLQTELKKKRNLKQLIYFFRDLLKIYFREFLKIYKQSFDLEYKKQQKEFTKYNKIKQDLQRAIKMLQYIDNQMAKMGLGRQERRTFWRDFYKNGKVRTDIFNKLLKEVG